MAKELSAEEKKWRAESDARTLAEAEAIKADPKRLKVAQGAAKEMAEEEERRAKAMKAVADDLLVPVESLKKGKEKQQESDGQS